MGWGGGVRGGQGGGTLVELMRAGPQMQGARASACSQRTARREAEGCVIGVVQDGMAPPMAGSKEPGSALHVRCIAGADGTCHSTAEAPAAVQKLRRDQQSVTADTAWQARQFAAVAPTLWPPQPSPPRPTAPALPGEHSRTGMHTRRQCCCRGRWAEARCRGASLRCRPHLHQQGLVPRISAQVKALQGTPFQMPGVGTALPQHSPAPDVTCTVAPGSRYTPSVVPPPGSTVRLCTG